MSTTTDSVRIAQQQYLEAFKQGQEILADAVGIWAKSVEGYAARSESLPTVDLPSPKELAGTTFAFVERLVAAQKQFTLAVIDAAGPVLDQAAAKQKPAKSA